MKITTVANAIRNLPTWAKWSIGGYILIGLIFNACNALPRAGSSPSKEAIVKTADQAKEKCLGYLDKEKLPLVKHEFDMAQPKFTDNKWEYSGMASFVGGEKEQRAIYRCHIDEQGDLLLFEWGG